jgi:hypothetical protein
MNRRELSQRDSLRFLALLENPPAANDRLVRVAKAGFTLPPAPTTDTSKRVFGDKIRIAEFRVRSRRRTFSTGAAPRLPVAHQAVFPHGSMNFRSFEAVNDLRPPEAAREARH